jgi:hypothetical protein
LITASELEGSPTLSGVSGSFVLIDHPSPTSTEGLLQGVGRAAEAVLLAQRDTFCTCAITLPIVRFGVVAPLEMALT